MCILYIHTVYIYIYTLHIHIEYNYLGCQEMYLVYCDMCTYRVYTLYTYTVYTMCILYVHTVYTYIHTVYTYIHTVYTYIQIVYTYRVQLPSVSGNVSGVSWYAYKYIKYLVHRIWCFEMCVYTHMMWIWCIYISIVSWYIFSVQAHCLRCPQLLQHTATHCNTPQHTMFQTPISALVKQYHTLQQCVYCINLCNTLQHTTPQIPMAPASDPDSAYVHTPVLSAGVR